MCYDSQLTDTYLALGRSTKKRNTKILRDPELAALASDIPKIILQDRAPNTVKKCRCFPAMEFLGEEQRAASSPNYGTRTGIILSIPHKECKINGYNLHCWVRNSMGPSKNVHGFPDRAPNHQTDDGGFKENYRN